MGYASPSPLTSGIHTRLYSRAFVIDDGINRVVFVSADVCMIDQAVKTEVSFLYEYIFSVWCTCVNETLLAGHFLFFSGETNGEN